MSEISVCKNQGVTLISVMAIVAKQSLHEVYFRQGLVIIKYLFLQIQPNLPEGVRNVILIWEES
jgi:hypothetical protein